MSHSFMQNWPLALDRAVRDHKDRVQIPPEHDPLTR